MTLRFEENKIESEEIPLTGENGKNITLIIARLDKIHPVVSGNKLFKLHYFLESALRSTHKSIITFGGAYSNHLAATSYACKVSGLNCIGIVRGEEPTVLSPTLQFCRQNNMQLQFISREQYKTQSTGFPDEQHSTDTTKIPEGGYHPHGARGASLIYDRISHLSPTHICTPVGSATTLAGLLMTTNSAQIIGIPVLKNMTDIPERIKYLLSGSDTKQPEIFNEYHFGGYAKITDKLLTFMNNFYNTYYIPLDFVYTAKMMYAVIEKINEGYFASGSRIVCLHTGGLQGNNSLKKGVLVY